MTYSAAADIEASLVSVEGPDPESRRVESARVAALTRVRHCLCSDTLDVRVERDGRLECGRCCARIGGK